VSFFRQHGHEMNFYAVWAGPLVSP